MSDFDDKIRDALGDEDAELPKKMEGEPSMPQQILDTFRGRNRWLAIGAFVSMTFLFAWTVFACVRFFGAEETNLRLSWGFGAQFGLLSVMAVKIWFWMQLNKNILSREMKRLELQVAILNRK